MFFLCFFYVFLTLTIELVYHEVRRRKSIINLVNFYISSYKLTTDFFSEQNCQMKKRLPTFVCVIDNLFKINLVLLSELKKVNNQWFYFVIHINWRIRALLSFCQVISHHSESGKKTISSIVVILKNRLNYIFLVACINQGNYLFECVLLWKRDTTPINNLGKYCAQNLEKDSNFDLKRVA